MIGMTNIRKAKLAREAELSYACVAMVTDYGSWHPDHVAVEITDIIKVLARNADKARNMVQRLSTVLAPPHSLC